MLDEKRRVVLPRDVTEALGVFEGSEIAFEKGKGIVIIKKAGKKEDALRKIMAWNPKRTSRVLPVKEAEVKKIWH